MNGREKYDSRRDKYKDWKDPREMRGNEVKEINLYKNETLPLNLQMALPLVRPFSSQRTHCNWLRKGNRLVLYSDAIAFYSD
jgi:hypothetical protein